MIKVSVVLPTYNRLNRLKQVLRALELQDFPKNLYQVIIISDGSTDGTDEYLHTLHAPFQLIPVGQTNQGAAAARNCGINRSSGEIVLFLDDDVVPTPQLISEHVKWHETHQDAVVIGPMITPSGFVPSPWVRWMHQRLAEQYEAMNNSLWQPTARQFYTGNASVARCHLIESGGFDTSFARAEDVELAYRLADRGLRFLFNSHAVGYHYEERSFASWIAIPYAYGCNDIIFSQEKGQPWLLETVLNEFYSRHPVLQWMVRLCLDRPLLSSVYINFSRGIGQFSDRLHLDALHRFAFSSIFNLRYYQGVADTLRGRQRLLSLLDTSVEAAQKKQSVKPN